MLPAREGISTQEASVNSCRWSTRRNRGTRRAAASSNRIRHIAATVRDGFPPTLGESFTELHSNSRVRPRSSAGHGCPWDFEHSYPGSGGLQWIGNGEHDPRHGWRFLDFRAAAWNAPPTRTVSFVPRWPLMPAARFMLEALLESPQHDDLSRR
jgi:hypothetical protein